MTQTATLEEIERHWSFNDLMRANELLDVRAELEEVASEATQS